MRTVGAEGECTEEVRSAGGLVTSIHNTSYHNIYLLSIGIREVLVAKLVLAGNGKPQDPGTHSVPGAPRV